MPIAQTDAPSTRDRILAATFEAVADFGISRLTMEDVAGRAGCSRQTLYRYFRAKEDLVLALVLREEERFLDGVRAAFAANEDLEEAIREAVLFVLASAREHPLLDRLLRTDRAALLPALTTDAAPVIARGGEVLAGLLRARGAERAAARRAADAAIRLMISYVLAPPGERPDHVARTLAAALTGAIRPGRTP